MFGLIDYMVESECLALMDWIYDNLKVGGYALFSLTRPNVDTPLLVHLLEWLMHERTPEEFKDIVSRSKFASSIQEWIEDGSGVVNYLVLKKDG